MALERIDPFLTPRRLNPIFSTDNLLDISYRYFYPGAVQINPSHKRAIGVKPCSAGKPENVVERNLDSTSHPSKLDSTSHPSKSTDSAAIATLRYPTALLTSTDTYFISQRSLCTRLLTAGRCGSIPMIPAGGRTIKPTACLSLALSGNQGGTQPP